MEMLSPERISGSANLVSLLRDISLLLGARFNQTPICCAHQVNPSSRAPRIWPHGVGRVAASRRCYMAQLLPAELGARVSTLRF